MALIAPVIHTPIPKLSRQMGRLTETAMIRPESRYDAMPDKVASFQ
ncbi:hypothetical protein SHXM_09917 [Streptomyces hygroscopicus]|nr:hypothetical protein SHXM_09917 [Streptomyces hygroscopicus]